MELTMCKSWMLYGAVSRGLCFTLFPINATERWKADIVWASPSCHTFPHHEVWSHPSCVEEQIAVPASVP